MGGTGGGGSLRGEETGQRAREPGPGAFPGVRKASPRDDEVAQGSLTPTHRSPHPSRGGRKYRGSLAAPWGWFLGVDGGSVSGFSLFLGFKLPDKPAAKPYNCPPLTQEGKPFCCFW